MMWAMCRKTRDTLVCVLPVLVFGEIMGWNGAEAKNEYYYGIGENHFSIQVVEL